MATPSEELQIAVIAALKADAAVAAEVGDRVTDGRPDLDLGPCITMGPSDHVLDDPDCLTLRTETLQIDVWVQSAAGRIWPARALADKVAAALHRASPDLATHALARLDVGRVRTMLDEDGMTGHGIVTVEADIEER